MAACGSLEHIFDKPLPENPTFLDSLSPWKHIKSMKPIDDSSFTEIFGELHFKENHIHASPESPSPSSSSSSSSSPLSESSASSSSSSSNSSFWAYPNSPKRDDDGISGIQNKTSVSTYCHPSSQRKQYGHCDSFSSMNSESLSLCTEGLGFESFDDVEDLLRHDLCNKEGENQDEGKNLARNPQTENHCCRNESKVSSRTSKGAFPPPISCIGRSGKPWVCFKSYREDGRFILKEIRIPTQEFLHACRENGRLKLQFIQSDDEIVEEDEEEDEDENEDNVEEEDDDDDDREEEDRSEREEEDEDQDIDTR